LAALECLSIADLLALCQDDDPQILSGLLQGLVIIDNGKGGPAVAVPEGALPSA